LPPDELATVRLFEESSKSVIYVSPVEHRPNFLTLNLQEVPQGTGSGFIWDDQGHIVTNFHVVRDADGVNVTLWNQETYSAEAVGFAPHKDIAVLRINAPASKLRPIPIGTSGDLRVGQKVMAIGNPFGLDFTLTTGVVSALNREIRSVTGRAIQGVVQTDAAINPGSSGGPLLDSAGRLIGINTAIVSPSGANAGIGFSVPVDEVNRVVPQLIAYGKVTQPVLGIHPADERFNRRFGGVVIHTVRPNFGADKAGLRGIRQTERGFTLGDVITHVENIRIRTFDELDAALDRYNVGDVVNITIYRNNRQEEMAVTLQALN
jgi:S1-C subfamily serine protease